MIDVQSSDGRSDLMTSVILAIGSLDVGGTETQVVRLATELHHRGHDVTVLVISRGDGPLATPLRESGVPIWDLGFEHFVARTRSGRIRPLASLRLWSSWLRLVIGLRRRRPDVVHAFLFWSYVLVLPAAWLARVPVRVSGRRNLGTEKLARPLYPWLERIADACATHVVANSQAVADVVAAGPVPAGKLSVIRNGVDLRESAEHVDAQPPLGVIIANLIAYKGHLDLVDALATLSDPPRIDCYGEGPERPRIEERIRERGLGDVVLLRGRRPGAADAYRQAQFAVLASHEEGFPNAVLEAMATGLPVVATAVGGVPELVRDGETGLLVPPHDPEALGGEIGRLVADPDLRVRLGRAARERAEELSWHRCVEAHERLYAERLDRHGG